MIKRLGKYERRTLLLFLLILTTFIVIGSSVIYVKERYDRMRRATLYAEREIELIGKLITEALIKRDYATVELFIGQWTRERPDLVEVKLTTANGFVLVSYVRTQSAKYRLPLRRLLTYGDQGSVTVDMVWDMAAVHQSLNQLLVILVAIQTILVALLLLFLWWVLRCTLLLPLYSELEERERYLSLTLDSIGDAVIATDGGGCISRMNPVAETLTGWRMPEAAGRPLPEVFRIINAQTREPVADPVEKVLRTGKVVRLANHTALISKDGAEYHIDDSGAPITDNDGNLLGVVLVFHDITERKQAEEAFQTLIKSTVGSAGQEFFDNTAGNLVEWLGADCVIIGELIDKENVKALAMMHDGEIIRRYSYKLSGTPCESVAMKGFCFYPEGIIELFPDDRDLVEMGAEGYAGVPLLDKSGNSIGVVCAITRHKLSLPPMAKDVFEIIAARTSVEIERRRAEDELIKHRDHLEDLVDERTAELRSAQEELLRKQRLASIGQMTATVSHELRNPLGSIRNALAVIRRLAGKENPMMKSAMEITERGVSRCDNIITELLDFTRVRELNSEPTDLDAWLGEVLDAYEHAPEIELVREPGAGVEVPCDRERLLRAALNVLDNACDAVTVEEGLQDPSRMPRVSVTTRIVDDGVEIEIADNGPGMSAEKLAKAFEPLFSTKSFGVGLGLPVVKQIMEQHRGSVHIESEPGEGARVRLLLPLHHRELGAVARGRSEI